MKKAATASVVFILAVCAGAFSASAADMKGKVGVGINYPGISGRYFVSDKVALELKAQTETNAMAAGLRGNYYFASEPQYGLFAGLEADYVTFKGEVSEGTGYAVEPYIGGEFFVAKSLSLQLDFGPAIIMLQDKDVTDASVNGLEYVVNFGINYYF